ncbi:MAG: hypothetical protein SFX19_10380 [Alphaproteobacteria bacterium]|nr:hypothetical protein [Alphaproteobacteria bacterium]
MPTNWNNIFKQAIEWPGKFLENGGHAQQEIPSQHRLLNAGGMFLAWFGMDQVRQVVFGYKMKSEGEYVEIKREEVSPSLRFLHKAIEWDPHSETPENQWKKLAYQLFPGVGAGVGATVGSIYAFNRNGREQRYAATAAQKTLSMLDADYNAQFAQAMPLRILAGFFGTFSAASGLTFLYGFFLNPAFASANGAKIFAGSLKHGNAGPEKALGTELGRVGSYIEEAIKTGKVSDEWAKTFEARILEPLFGHELRTPEAQAKAVKTLQGIVEDSYKKFNANGKPAKEIAKAVTDDLAAKLGKGGIEKTLRESFGLDPKKATVGNANPVIRQFNEFLASLGLSKSYSIGSQTKTPAGYLMPALGVSGAAAGMAYTTTGTENTASASEAATDASPALPAANNTGDGQANGEETSAAGPQKHLAPEAAGKTPAEYVAAAVAMHNEQYGNGQGQPPEWLKWMGNAQLAVLPTNRMDCAIGLTAGQIIGGSMAKIATGYSIEGAPVDSSKVPTYLKWMQGIVKDYNPKGLRPRDRWIRYAQWGVFSLGGLIGVKIGTDFAYGNVKNKNKDPDYLEDYLPRISMHQGENWSWLAAFSANFGSASGLWTLPIPGLNYGIGLAGRAVSMQDRNFMLPGGLGKFMSGTATTSFLRLREGINYLCHYAVGNPAQDPAQIEYLAYTMLEPIFKDQLTVEHIRHFTEAVHEVRDHYWKDGGIPKKDRKEALAAMREVFTGPGLEVLLIDMGLNPGAIEFEQLNGVTGKIGNLGITDKIRKEQENYQKSLLEHLKTYVKEGMISQERADWVKAGIEAMKRGKKQAALGPTEDEVPGEPIVITPKSAKFTDKVELKPSIRDLIKRAEREGDWRDAAQISREHSAPIAFE